MFGWAEIRPEERRATLVAMLTLAGFMAGHATLETARDALFLTKLPSSQLPIVYIVVAVISLAIALFSRSRAASGTGLRLCGLFGGVSLVTALFGLFLGSPGTLALYALYVFSAVVATVVLAQFWLLVGARFSATQAKRTYPFIGVGSVFGAIVGSGLSGLLSFVLPARGLVFAAAVLFFASAAGPVMLERIAEAPKVEERGRLPRKNDAAGSLRALERPYSRRIALLLGVSTIVLTLGDYVWKTEAAASLAPERLAGLFALVAFVLNVVSLGVQLFAVRPAVRALSVSGALLVLPVLLLLGASGVALGGGLGAALLLKGADGALRHSLHRTASELLFVPLPTRARAAAKTLVDVFGQRASQALASVLLLAVAFVGAGIPWIGAGMVVVTFVWIGLAWRLRPHYLELFRSTLRDSATTRRVELPSLDLGSLESIIAALNSPHDGEVRAALALLAEEGKARLVPTLLLYHPSADVVSDALDLFVRAGRKDFVPIADRVLASSDRADIRAACLRARMAVSPDRALLERYATDPEPRVRATALVCLVALEHESEEALARVEQVVDEGPLEARIALAEAIRYRPRSVFEDVLMTLSRTDEVELLLATLRAMATAPSARFLGPILKMLTVRELRAEVRETLVRMGETALGFLQGALADEERPIVLRRHLPRTIMRFSPPLAARILLEQLPIERDGVVRYKLLRALGHLRAVEPELPLDRATLELVTRATAVRAYELLASRLVLERGRAREPKRETEAHGLLVRLLRDKEQHAIERLFRLLGLLHPAEDVAAIFRGLRSQRPESRASSRELVEHMVATPLRAAVLGLIDDAADEVRLAAGAALLEKSPAGYEALLAEMVASSSESLRALAAYHAAELGLSDLRVAAEAVSLGPSQSLAGVVDAARRTFAAFAPPRPALG